MVLPTPIAPIVDACSVIYDNTLYSYSSTIFQSLPLQEGGEWAELPMGVSVEGGACVKATPQNDTAAALYIVGGTTNTSDYYGLQRFNFSTQTWETVQPSTPVTQNRLYHNALYLNASDAIFVYAGTQDGEDHPSSQAFTIQASEPYNVLAFTSEVAPPPATFPILLPWSDSEAVYIGGSTTNKQVMLFSPLTSWADPNITLAEPLYSTTAVRAVIADGDDGSKSLYTFDMSVSPNSVNRTLLLGADGVPVQNSAPVVSRSLIMEEEAVLTTDLARRASLTATDWPVYNDTLAPKSTRTAYSVAMDQNTQVVISGGNTDDVLCIFKATQNAWVNASAELSSKSAATVEGLSLSPSSSSSLASATAASTASSTATNSSADGPTKFPVKVLGAVLGSIAGVAVILLALLLLYRWRKDKKQFNEMGHQRRSSGSPDKGSNDMADVAYAEKSAFSPASPRFRHGPSESHGSFSSVAMLMGRVPKGHSRGASKGLGSMQSETSSHFNKNYKNTIAISNPIPQEPVYSVAVPAPAVGSAEKRISFARERSIRRARDPPASKSGNARRSSGWNRYWSGGSALNILGFGSKRTTYDGSDRDSDISDISEKRRPSALTQASAAPPPLSIPNRPEINSVASGSPRLASAADNYPLKEEMSGQIGNYDARSSVSSSNDRYDGYSSGVPESDDDWRIGRAVSDAYTASVYGATLPKGSGSVFPHQERPPPPSRPQYHGASSDMSWLNLGPNSRI